MKQGTVEEIAERIVAELDWMDFKSLAPKKLKSTIVEALRNEREGCAKVAEGFRHEWSSDNEYLRIANGIAASIRNGR